jgi:hypothetical protein
MSCSEMIEGATRDKGIESSKCFGREYEMMSMVI